MTQDLDMEFQSNKVKKLPPSVVKDIELKNHARRLADLFSYKDQSEDASHVTLYSNQQVTELVAAVLEALVT